MRVPNSQALFVVAALVLHVVICDYMITTPRKWISNHKAQICISSKTWTSDDRLNVTLNYIREAPLGGGFNGGGCFGFGCPPIEDKPLNLTNIAEKIIVPAADKPMQCFQFQLPVLTKDDGIISFVGKIGGVDVNKTETVAFATDTQQTYIQTDKYLYKAGQKVQFRVLTLEGPFAQVSTEPYAEIYIESPSGSRIAQWLNVENPDGLVHLYFQLIEEPEEGIYQIKVQDKKTHDNQIVSQLFMIEDYVLPRFEVSLKPPSFLLANSEVLNLEVCATYTFGQPVRGKANINIQNDGWGRHKAEINFDEQELLGCKKMEIPLRTFGINSPNRFVYSLKVKATVVEDGTGNSIETSTDIPVERTALKIEDVGTFFYDKPELPSSKTVKVTFPDGSPAANELMSACPDSQNDGTHCKNVTTDASGLLTFVVPPHLVGKRSSVESVNYPALDVPSRIGYHYMYASSYFVSSKMYYSPTNSTLLFVPDSTSLTCTAGETIDINIPVMFAAVNMTEAIMQVQVVSRGQIQYWETQTVALTPGNLPIDESKLLEPMQPPYSQHTVRGSFNVPISLPTSVSPSIKVLIWYSRPDGEVVSDSREFEISNCLPHKVSLTWPLKRVEQGTTLPLTLSAQPNSLCSVGIVDKSVELLSSSRDKLTVAKVLDFANTATVSDYENSQIDDYSYCEKKRREDLLEETPSTEVPIEDIEIRRKRSSPPRYRRYSASKVDALRMFDSSGLLIVSDLTVETRPCNANNDYGYGILEFDLGGGGDRVFASVPQPAPPRPMASPDRPAAGQAGAGAFEEKTETTSSEPRTYFPETWLWELNVVHANGSHVQDLELPHTITEWVGRAVCVHPRSGLGISPTSSIVTFTPFFIDLTVLPTVKKGEIMPIKISVFNYLEAALPVRITLEPSVEYEILEGNGTVVAANQSAAGVHSVCIDSQDKQTVTVRIRPLKVGDVNVTVVAAVDPSYPEQCGPEVIINKVDRIISPIVVEYEGFPREKTWTKFLCNEDNTVDQDYAEKWLLEAPQGIVPESARSWVTVVGDLLGPTLDNLGHLIKMPYGCGEQNMLNFAPNIFVLQYLEESGQNTPATNETILNYMKSGYQRELNYKHRDGSYSAFGESDDSGSTWLTAFVVKSFAQARQYISIDSTVLAMARDWLKNRAMENGCFESVGKVLHKGMKGGLSAGGNPTMLTSYVLVSLLEAGEDPASEVITNAQFCLERAAATETPGPYELSIKAYAMGLARQPDAKSALDELLAKAVNTPEALYWDIPSSSGSSRRSDATSAVAVETAGYALMAMMVNGPELYATEAHRLLKWISAQRNSQGGFVSTQDTIVALQAMALYESHQSQDPLDSAVSFVGGGIAESFKVTESNKLLTQRADVPNVPAEILVDIAGTGCALVQGVVRYNVEKGEPSEAFSISVSTSVDNSDNTCETRRLKTCASYLLNDGASNMAVIEITLISGYIPKKEDLKRIVGYGTGIIKRYEIDGNKVLFYIDEFTARDTCVEFSVKRETTVEDAKPGTVKVYDYYEPEFSVSETYEFPRFWDCVRPTPVPLPIIIIDDGESGIETETRPPLPPVAVTLPAPLP